MSKPAVFLNIIFVNTLFFFPAGKGYPQQKNPKKKSEKVGKQTKKTEKQNKRNQKNQKNQEKKQKQSENNEFKLKSNLK